MDQIMRLLFSKILSSPSFLFVSLFLPLCFIPQIQAQEQYPNQPIKFIVPFSPGGLPDTVARQISVFLGERLSQPVVVENKPGAGGIVAGQVVKALPADGYTFMITDTISFNTSNLLYSNSSFDLKKDFKPIAIIAKAPNFLTISSNLPVNNFSEFSNYVKYHPGQLNYGSSGIGSPHHLAMEALRLSQNWNISHIPYKGTSQSVPALVGGQVQAIFAAYPSVVGFEKNGKVKIIGVAALKPSKLAPEIPALGASIPGFEYVHTIAIFGLNGVPNAVTNKLNQELSALVTQPKIVDSFKPMGIEFEVYGPKESSQWLNDESERINKLIREAAIKLN
jgi:tripartite-type tricarboxylate transporter receptor subunit TctC